MLIERQQMGQTGVCRYRLPFLINVGKCARMQVICLDAQNRECIEVTDEIISYVKCSPGKKISDNIYISLTHLRFFSQRLIGGKLYTTEDKEFCEMIRGQYPREYGCVERIRDYILKEYDHRMTEAAVWPVTEKNHFTGIKM